MRSFAKFLMQAAGVTIGAGLALPWNAAWAQTATTPAQHTLSVIDEDPITSTRANGMGGAISTVADDLDAAFHNPAGIGGLGNQKGKSDAWVRKLYFPWVSASANQNTTQLNKELSSSGASHDAAVAKTVIDAHADERAYGRANVLSGMVLGRLMIVPFDDVQFASTARGQGTNLLDTRYRDMSGVGFGASARSNDGRISMGYFGYAASRTETAGAFNYDDMISPTARDKTLKANTQKYSGVGNNGGIIWRMGNKGSPTLGVNVKNAGNTNFKGSDGTLQVKQDVTAGFSLSPQIGKSGVFNFILEADRLTDNDVSFIKKYRIGTELLLGGIGSYATFGVRAGYNYAGPSAGLNLNLGLIAFEVSVYNVDIAADNSRVVERRGSATAFVNVADF